MALPSTAIDPARPPLPAEVDVLVAGGGINGAGIARDLAGRGLSVLLAERDDLAAHTSSASTKLIHGGLRYLEHYEFGLVRKALAERELLLRSAPHIMRPLRFVMPHDPSMRPVWMIRAGLFLYDHLAQREWLPGSTTVALGRHPAGAPLKPEFKRGFVYSDGWVDDARLVVLNALDAQAHGAVVLTRCSVAAAERDGAHWRVRLHARHSEAAPLHVRARALINAAGPWAGQFLREQLQRPGARALRLVKGSHIVVPRLFTHDHAYIFQNPDRRIIFAIPYEAAFTLIGTTDVEVHGEPGAARIDADEIDYLCTQASRYFRQPVRPEAVVWSYSGVRPLLDDEAGDAAAVTRDYLLELDGDAATGQAPLLTVWGGKITTFRKLAEEAADELLRRLGQGSARAGWTRNALLPGGDLSAWIGAPQRPDLDIARFTEALGRRYPQFAAPLLARWAHAYGSRVSRWLDGARPDLGREIAPGLYEAELHYLQREEWARSAEDLLWRRSKLGLHYTPAQRAAVAQWCAGAASAGATREASCN